MRRTLKRGMVIVVGVHLSTGGLHGAFELYCVTSNLQCHAQMFHDNILVNIKIAFCMFYRLFA